MNKLLLAITTTALLLLAAGCAARPELVARSAANPADIDLSGRWTLQGEDGEALARVVEPDQGIYLPPASRSSRSQRNPVRASNSRRSKSPSVHVFIENGHLLQITQTEHGLFVSFDRAVVEEYTFGENRIITLGPIEAQRVSGWEGPAFVVETMDDRGATLTETWALAKGGSQLVREIGIMDGEKQLFASIQVFDAS